MVELKDKREAIRMRLDMDGYIFGNRSITISRATRAHVNDYKYEYEKQEDCYDHFPNNYCREIDERFTRMDNNLMRMIQVLESDSDRFSRRRQLEDI